jgi:5-methylcytosine-specific restriction endonuclease McrA
MRFPFLSGFKTMRSDIDAARDVIIEQLKSGVPQRTICIEFDCKPDTLRKRLKAWGMEHLNNMPGRGRPKPWARKSALDYLRPDIKTNVHRLKLKLWRDGLKPTYCEECGWDKQAANGRLPLELHHINGNKRDNRLENLRILCPNCHALKDNHRGLSKAKNYRRANQG